MAISTVFNSLSERSRQLKMALLWRYLPMRGDERILDIGSEVDARAHQLLERIETKSRITAVNLHRSQLEEIRSAFPTIHLARANACRLPFEDKAFDLVYSNAVIEHVGDLAAQKAMADEVRRVGKSWFVTTPNRWFPFEFHVRMPLVSWLPARWMHFAASLWGYNHHLQRYQSGIDYGDIRLLTARQLSQILPDSLIVRPRVTIWPETLVVVGPREALASSPPLSLRTPQAGATRPSG